MTFTGKKTMRTLLKSTLPLMLITVLAACSGGADHLAGGDATAQMGRAALTGGAPAIALQVGASMLKEHPQNPEALALQADALSALGRRQFQFTASYWRSIPTQSMPISGLAGY